MSATQVRSTGDRITGLFWLSKLFMYQNYFGWLLAWLLLTPAAATRPGATAAILLFLLGTVGIVTCTVALDDLVGYRNGSDGRNYSSSGKLRDPRMKPLLSGLVTEAEATAYVVFAACLAVVAGLGAFQALDWDVPLAAYLLYFVGGLASVQYSAGLRFSYHLGGAETLLCAGTAAGLLAPYLAIEQRWSAPAVLVALLLGLWLVMVSSYSNVNDADGDRRVGRRTLAAAAPPVVVKTAMVAFFAISVVLIGLLVGLGGWPWWTALTAAPVVVVHARQLVVGPLGGQWLRARRLGIVAYNLGFAGLLIPAVHLGITQGRF
ncbi:UbiA family prenyltransferase [Nocardia mexicana]|uniref:1,4-dihydroxy-2-naphthoate octaprenyltransferase n=1 Tax=Nocardia mexicana TaxID=279262 RepID=A0A370H331_9NOCA|nr:UbiA family prenyltransferase [Nocardia mexicana]RDI49988.1 1,4-dihydroxy-2-naphthoate octaprenyltransferase [Nocardia mexicana]